MRSSDTIDVHPFQLGTHDFSTYALVIDARSPHEYAEDHIPGAVNLPVVDDEEYAEVGTMHRDNTHGAYLIGVEYSLRNIANHIKPLISKYGPGDRFLVYCFRGGKRSRLWADNLRTIGFSVDVLEGGWKNYRRWVRMELESLPRVFEYRVLSGSTGCGKTRLLHALANVGEQTIDLEALASHRGSLIGAVPGHPQPTQKYFDSLLLDQLRQLDRTRPVWIEAESKKIGVIQLPDSLNEAMHRTIPVNVSAPMSERLRLWREDYPHFVEDPISMVQKLSPLKPLIGSDELKLWRDLAAAGNIDALFERIMVAHYDPCYARSLKRSFTDAGAPVEVSLPSLSGGALLSIAAALKARLGVAREH